MLKLKPSFLFRQKKGGGVGFPYVYHWLIKKLLWPSNRAEQSKVGIPIRDRGAQQAESDRCHVAAREDKHGNMRLQILSVVSVKATVVIKNSGQTIINVLKIHSKYEEIIVKKENNNFGQKKVCRLGCRVLDCQVRLKLQIAKNISAMPIKISLHHKVKRLEGLNFIWQAKKRDLKVIEQR